MRRATGLILQRHHILRLPRKMTRMIDARHIWNVIYNARSNRHHPPTSPNTVPATQNCIPKSKRNLPTTVEVSFTMRGRFDHDPCMNSSSRTRPFAELTFRASETHFVLKITTFRAPAIYPNFTEYCACHEKWGLQDHEILRLPRKMTRIIDPRDIWNVIYNARSNRTHPPTSPNTAPATLNHSHEWCPSHMKRDLQCAEQQASPSNLTKYCACHVKWHAWLMPVTYETWFTMRGATGITLQPHQILRAPRKIAFQNLREIVRQQLKCHLQCAADSTMIRAWTRHLAPARSPSLLFALRRRILSWKLQHSALRLSTQISPNTVTLQDHQILHLPRKMTRIIDPRDIWNVIYNARSNRTHPPTSPNTAPATINHSHDWCPSHMKRHLQCAEQQASPSNLTKYCACHVKWLSWLMSVTYETSFTMRGATSITLQGHQVLHLPRKMTRMIDARHIWNVIYNARSDRHHPPTSPNTAPATQNCIPKSKRNCPKTVEAVEVSFTMRGRFDHDPSMNSSSRTRPFAELTFRASETHFVLKITTFRAPAIYPNFTKYCACHEKWHSNITKCCACHEKWHSKITKYCACHEKWRSKITKCCACHETWHSKITKYCACHEKCHSEITKYCACHELGLETWMHCYFTVTFTALLLYCYFYCTVTLPLLLLHCYFTVTFIALLLYCYFYCTVTLLLLLLHCYFTVTFPALLLYCYFTALLLYCYFTYFYCTLTLLLLLLHCYLTVTFTALLLYCYFVTLLLLLLHCYFTVTFTALLLYCYFYLTWTVTVLDSLHF